MNIGFIGFGSMAKAIASGLLKNKKYKLFVAAPSLPIGMHNQLHTYNDNKEVIKKAEVIILAVKPAQMDIVLKEIRTELSSNCLLISVAAGLSLEWFAQRLDQQPLIRTMPNMPASIGIGATAMIANAYVSSEQRHWAEIIFATIGCSHWAPSEELIDSFTALSGSGPAYVFLFVEALVNAATALGLEHDVAKRFALQTCKGALQLAEHSDLSLSELRNQVTSPGGTTAAALNILHPQLEALLFSAMKAAKERAHELGTNN